MDSGPCKMTKKKNQAIASRRGNVCVTVPLLCRKYPGEKGHFQYILSKLVTRVS